MNEIADRVPTSRLFGPPTKRRPLGIVRQRSASDPPSHDPEAGAMPSANPSGDAPPSATDSASPPVSVVLAQPPSPRPASADLVGERLLAILRAPLRGDETVAAGFARKEQELRFVLASMSSMDARHLYKRLTIPQDGDVLVATFARLTVERRTRLLAFIADARRREAIAAARR